MTSPCCFSRALAVSLTVLFLLMVHSAHAQRSNTRGLYLNAHLNAASIAYDQDAFNTQSGGGLGLGIGYGVSHLMTLFLSVNGSVMSDAAVENAFTLAHVDAGAQFNIGRPRSAARPYGVLALTFRQATFEIQDANQLFEIDFTGGGLTVGGGLKYFLSRAVAVDLGLGFTFGKFTDVQVGGVAVQNVLDLNATSARLSAGLSFFPMRR